MRRPPLLLLLTLAACAEPPTAEAPAAALPRGAVVTYTPQFLPTPTDRPTGVAYAVNSGDIAVGWVEGPAAARQAVYWTATGQLGVLPVPILRGWRYVTEAHAINGANAVAGRLTATGPGPFGTATSAAYWPSLTSAPITFGLSGYSAEAFDVNSNGMVVGQTQTATGSSGFVWSSTRGFQLLPLPPGDTQAAALAVNDQGRIVGWGIGLFGCRTALQWTPIHGGSYGVAELTLPGACSSVARDINGSGIIVGYSAGGGPATAVRFGGGLVTSLVQPTLSDAFAVNALGRVVGVRSYPADSAFTIPPLGPGVALQPPSYSPRQSMALGVSDCGTIVGADYLGTSWWPSPSLFSSPRPVRWNGGHPDCV